MRFAKLIKRIVLRNVREERFLTALSVFGIALGVGLFMGVTVATNRAVTSFEANINSLNPDFNYEVVSTSGTDFQENVYRPVHAIDEKSAPALTANAYVPGSDASITINGIYTVKALAFPGASSIGRTGAEDFITNLNGVLLTKKYADSHHLKKGDIFRAYVYNKEYSLTVVGILDAPSIPSNTVFMDLGNFQEHFGKIGHLTRIDVAAGEKTAEEIARVLPTGLAVEKKQKILQDQKSLTDAFRFNLRFVTFLAVLVGVFLLYNTVFMSVVKRRTDIGILRGLGMGRKTVVALFSAQGMILGFAGSVLGVAFGQLCAWFSITMVEKTITGFYGSTAASDYTISTSDALWTIALGLFVSFFASLVPALESANVRPNESAREGTFEKAYGHRERISSATGAILMLCGAVTIYADYRFVPFNFPWLSYAGVVLFILGCTLNAPSYLHGVLRALTGPLSRLFKAPARIAVGDIKGSRYRFSMALMSVAVSSALIVATISSVYSFKTSFIDWIHTYIAADVYIKPASCTSNFCFYPLADEVIKTVEHASGVENVGRYRAIWTDFHGHKVVVGFGNSALLWKYRPNISLEEKERLQRLALYREVSISDYLKVKYRIGRGDAIELQTPKGKVAFTVNNSSLSYSTMSGFLYMDRRWLKEYWGLDDATQLSVYLRKDQDAAQLVQNIEKSFGSRYALDITDNNELRRAALTIFDKSFALTYTIELIAIVISLIGVVNAFLVLVFEKKREISVLRYLGATWGHLRQAMVISAGMVGSAGITLGCIMGSVISIVITHVINKISFGWEVGFRIPYFTLSVLIAFIFITTMLAGLVPSYLARKIDPKAFISFE